MASTVAQVPADIPYVVGLASTFTVYPTYPVAQAAAIVLSAANTHEIVYTARVMETVVGGTPTTVPKGGRVDLQPQAWIIQAASTATYIPLDAATNAAFTLSGSNANAPVYVARVFQQCTG